MNYKDEIVSQAEVAKFIGIVKGYPPLYNLHKHSRKKPYAESKELYWRMVVAKLKNKENPTNKEVETARCRWSGLKIRYVQDCIDSKLQRYRYKKWSFTNNMKFLDPFVEELKSKMLLQALKPVKPLKKRWKKKKGSTQPAAHQPSTSSEESTASHSSSQVNISSTSNIASKYSDLFNDPCMQDLAVPKDKLVKIVNQLDICFNTNIVQSNPSESIHQTQKFNYDSNMDQFFNYIIRIAKTLSPLDQVILQKDVSNMIFEMKIRQLSKQ